MADIEKIKEITDSLYSSFIARDFFAKVLPGSVVISALVYSTYGEKLDFEQLQKIPTFIWFLVYGQCWIFGFFVQGLGERLNILRVSPEDESNAQYHARISDFIVSARNNVDRLQRERFLIIKEATGNMAVAVLMGLLIVLQQLFVPQWRTVLHAVLAVLGTYILLWFHQIHQSRERHWVMTVCEKSKSDSSSG